MNVEIRFIELEEVLEIHRSMIEHYGGATEIRDLKLLESAVATPQASFGGEYLHGDLFEMAAAYFYHLVSNHPFLDGNKRTGAAAAIIFLLLNGVRLQADEDRLVEFTLRTASGMSDKNEAVAFFRSLVE